MWSGEKDHGLRTSGRKRQKRKKGDWKFLCRIVTWTEKLAQPLDGKRKKQLGKYDDGLEFQGDDLGISLQKIL